MNGSPAGFTGEGFVYNGRVYPIEKHYPQSAVSAGGINTALGSTPATGFKRVLVMLATPVMSGQAVGVANGDTGAGGTLIFSLQMPIVLPKLEGGYAESSSGVNLYLVAFGASGLVTGIVFTAVVPV